MTDPPVTSREWEDFWHGETRGVLRDWEVAGG